MLLNNCILLYTFLLIFSKIIYYTNIMLLLHIFYDLLTAVYEIFYSINKNRMERVNAIFI